jgi:hypothetical protein
VVDFCQQHLGHLLPLAAVRLRTLAVLLVVAAGSACSGSVPSEEWIQSTRQSPPPSRDVPPSMRQDPVGHCPPCGRPFSCQVAAGQTVTVQSMKVPGGACDLLDNPTDIIVLGCDGSVATTTGRDVGSWKDDGQGNIVIDLPDETVTCGSS